VEAAQKLAQEAAAQARRDLEKSVSDARAEAARRIDGVLSEDAELEKTLAELRQAHERDRQKILEECAESLEAAKKLADIRRGVIPPAPEPEEKPGLFKRLFNRG
jgi:hypothetical protein